MFKTARLLLFSFFIFFIGIFLYKNTSNASGSLHNAKDILSDDSESFENVGHTVSFTVPYNSEGIVASDYILIDLSNFDNPTAATSITGSYMGTPSFSVDAVSETVKITNIYVEHGDSITIHGITATNPPIKSMYYVQVIVSEDEDGNIIKYITSFHAYSQGTVAEVTASIAPPVATLVVSGFAAPSMFLTFTENGTVIGTDTAGGSLGTFTKYLPGIDPTTHNISIYGVDIYHRTTSLLPFEIYTPIYQETTVSDLVLSPTIEISASTINQGTNLVAEGMTIPDGEVSIFTESPLRTYYATASAAGTWDYTIANTSDYNAGDYRIYSMVQNDSGLQSLFSNSLQFSIRSTSDPTPTGTASCDISEGDLNCDSSINLADFSILMYYWGSNNAAADINEDNVVNLSDFSIMMYYWGT